MKAQKIKAEIEAKQTELNYNRKRLFKRAHYLTRTGLCTFSQALSQVWREQKERRREVKVSIDILLGKLSFCYMPQLSKEHIDAVNYRSMVAAHERGTNLNQW
jgi:hypothetical protein